MCLNGDVCVSSGTEEGVHPHPVEKACVNAMANFTLLQVRSLRECSRGEPAVNL